MLVLFSSNAKERDKELSSNSVLSQIRTFWRFSCKSTMPTYFCRVKAPKQCSLNAYHVPVESFLDAIPEFLNMAVAVPFL